MDRVTAIKPLVFRQPVLSRPPESGIVETGPLEVGDLIFTTSETESEPLYEWFAKTVEAGGAIDERTGKLELLAPDFRTVLFTVDLLNLGIYWLATEDGDGSVLRRVTAKIYCEWAKFSAP